MEEIINPYIAGAPVTEKRMFFGREDVFTWIERSLSGQYADHILVVHGQRRVGKTSVLKQLSNQLPKRYIPIFFDLQGRTHTTLDRFLWWLAREIVRVLKQDRDITITPPDKDLFTQDIEYFETRFLPELRPVLGDDSILLLTFDEFDNLEESEIKEVLAQPLIDHLRRMMGNPNINFIFSIGSSGRKLENMQANYTEFFKTALYRKISFLTKDDAHRLITMPVQGLLEYEKDAVQHIFETVSGHPYFTQLICHELFSQCQKTGQRTISRVDVDAILDDVVERGTVNLKFVWDEAADLEKWSLACLAQLNGKLDTRAVTDYLTRQRVRFNQQALDSALLHLREKDVLTDDHRFVNQLLQIWLKKNRPIEQVREELTEVNPIANRYIEIGLEFKNSRQYQKAIESFQEALGIDADNLQARVNLALTHLDQKNVEKAILEFEKALAIDEEDIVSRGGLCDAYLAQGDLARERGRPREAILSYQKVLDINAEHTEARGRMAEISRQRAEKALEDGKDEEALNAFAEALKFTPEDQTLIERVEKVRAEKKAKVLAAQVARSEKEANARNWEKAIAALNEALAVSPADESILKRIESIKERQKKERLNAILIKVDQAEKTSRWDSAIAALNEYLLLQPDDAAIQKRLTDLIAAKRAAWLNSVNTRADQATSYQNWDDALAALNEVLAREPDNAEMKSKAAKIRVARRVAELNAMLRSVEQATQAGHWDDAINILNGGLASEPDNETLQAKLIEVRKAKREARLKAALRLADTAAQAGKWTTARESLKEVLASEPENGEFQKKLAEISKLERESKLAGLRTQARSFAKAEKFNDALAAWNEYVALEPDDREKALAEIESVKKALRLAQAYAEAYEAYSRKNYEKAINLFKNIVVEDTDYKDSTSLLAESIELRRTQRKWWQSKWLWGGIGAVAVLSIAWFALRPGSQLMNTLLTSAVTLNAIEAPATAMTEGSPATEIGVLPQTVTPTPLPLAWARLNSGQFLPRDQITAIVFDPTDPGVMYVSAYDAGIFKTIDGGISWQPAQNGLESKSVQTLVIDPNDTRTLFAGVIQGGVYKTEDGGANWRAINEGIDINGWEIISHVILDPNNSQHLLYTNSFTLSQNKVLYETLDGGESWYQIMDSDCPYNTRDIAMHPNNNQVLVSGAIRGSSCDGGIYLSEDGGRNWKIIGLKGNQVRWVAISETENKSELIYASTDDGQLFGTSDRGQTWTSLCASGCWQPLAVDKEGNVVIFMDGNIASSDGIQPTWKVIGPGNINNPSHLAFSPLQPNMLLLGGTGLNVSTDGGKSWAMQNSGLGAGSFYLQLSTLPGESLYLMQEGNAYISTDQGRSWDNFGDVKEHFSGIDIDGYLAFDNTSSLLYKLWQNEAVWSSDQGKTWTNISLPLPNPDFLGIHPQSSNRVFAGYGGESMQVFYSEDRGATWSESKVSCSTSDCFNYNLIFQPDTHQTEQLVIRGDQSPYISDDGGLNWKECSYHGTWIAYSPSAVAIDPVHKEKLIIATNGEGVNITLDGCQTLQSSNAGLGSLFVNSVAIDPNNPDTIYAGTDGGAYVSSNGGQTWGQVNDGLLGATVVYSIVVDKDSNVYAATPYGIFKLGNK